MESFSQVIDDINRRTNQRVNQLNAESLNLDQLTQKLYKSAEACAVEADRSTERLIACPSRALCEPDKSDLLKAEIKTLQHQLSRRKNASRSRQFSRVARTSVQGAGGAFYDNFITGSSCDKKEMHCTWRGGNPSLPVPRQLTAQYFSQNGANFECTTHVNGKTLKIMPEEQLSQWKQSNARGGESVAISWRDGLEKFGNDKIYMSLLNGSCDNL